MPRRREVQEKMVARSKYRSPLLQDYERRNARRQEVCS